MDHVRRVSGCGLVMALLLCLAACGTSEPPKPAQPPGLSMAELKAQKRAPLEVVSFSSSASVGDVILNSAMESDKAKDGSKAEAEPGAKQDVEVAMQRHVLTVANVSNCEVTAFRAKLTYEDEKGQVVTSEKATADTGYAADLSGGIQPGAKEQLELRLLVPKGTKAKLHLTEVLYKNQGLGGLWKADAGK